MSDAQSPCDGQMKRACRRKVQKILVKNLHHSGTYAQEKVLCLSTSGATRSAAPADDLVGFPEITPATTSHASEKVEEVKVQTSQTVADANILSPRVLTVVRAAPPAVPCP